MDTFNIIQSIFYLVSSITIIIIGIMVGIMIYYLIGILRDTRNITEDINHSYHKTKKSISKIINSFSGKKNEKTK